MSKPEIARRCPSCGASIREAAFFCPQCGKELPRRDSGETQPLIGPEAEETQRDSSETQPLISPEAEETIPKSAAAVSDAAVEPGMEAGKDAPVDFRNQSQNKKKPKNKAPVKAPATGAPRASVGQAAMGAVGARIQRATTLARDVEGDVMHRARKVREISNVVLDEAGYDPSLRFVLVAAFLFLVFLIIVLLNRFIT